MSEPFLGEIRMFGGNFAPNGWAFCDGQLLPINQYAALFSLLGTTYGGNGQTTFALPDLRGRAPLHPGQGPGLSPYTLGQSGGQESHQLLTSELPAHNHALVGSETGGAAAPGAGVLPGNSALPLYTRPPGNGPDTTLSPEAGGVTGGGQAHPNLQPYLALGFIIALAGIYPSRG